MNKAASLDSNSVILSESLKILKDSLIKKYLFSNFTQSKIPLRTFLNQVEKDVIVMAMHIAHNNQKQVSDLLEVKTSTLCEKIKKHDIKTDKKSMLFNYIQEI